MASYRKGGSTMTERFVLRNVKRVNGEEIDIVVKIIKSHR